MNDTKPTAEGPAAPSAATATESGSLARPVSGLVVLDRVCTVLLFLATPVAWVISYLLIALASSHWMDGTRELSHTAGIVALIVNGAAPLLALGLVPLFGRRGRPVFWLPLLSLVVMVTVTQICASISAQPA